MAKKKNNVKVHYNKNATHLPHDMTHDTAIINFEVFTMRFAIVSKNQFRLWIHSYKATAGENMNNPSLWYEISHCVLKIDFDKRDWSIRRTKNTSYMPYWRLCDKQLKKKKTKWNQAGYKIWYRIVTLLVLFACSQYDYCLGLLSTNS